MPISARMFRNVPLAMSRSRVDRDDHRPAIGMAHHVVASADSRDRESCPLKRPDHLRPRNCREGRPASGHVEGQRQLIRRTGLGQQRFQRAPQAGNRGFRGRAVAYRPGPRT